MVMFEIVFAISGLAQIALALCLLLKPDAMIQSFGVETNEVVSFVARRASMLFFGLAALSFGGCFLRSNLVPASVLLSVPWLGLAALGLFEHMRGFVGKEIYPAIGTETVIGLLLLAAALVASLRSGPQAG